MILPAAFSETNLYPRLFKPEDTLNFNQMRLSGRRNSNNIEDRRGISGKSLGIGGGIVGIIIVGIITLLQGGSVGDVLSNVIGAGGGQALTAYAQYVEPEEAARLALATAGEHGVLAFGSLYLASAVRPVMMEALKKN